MLFDHHFKSCQIPVVAVVISAWTILYITGCTNSNFFFQIITRPLFAAGDSTGLDKHRGNLLFKSFLAYYFETPKDKRGQTKTKGHNIGRSKTNGWQVNLEKHMERHRID